MELYNPSVIHGIKNKYGFKFSKSLGQNFLTDRSVLEGIVQGADISREDLVLEIGPGIGTLTMEAAKKAGKVVAVEIDGNLIEILSETLAGFDNVKVVAGNILKTDVQKLIAEEGGATLQEGDGRKQRRYENVKIIGNLPYYITTGIIMKLLEERLPVKSITIMMQKEVADRIKSGPGSRTYGAISVAVQYYCRICTVEEVPKECFMPMPKVDSTVLRLDIRETPPVDLVDEKMFFRCVKAGFGQRRKTLLNSLKGLQFRKEVIEECLKAAEIDPMRRAETLSLQDFATLANEFSQKRGNSL